MRHSATEAGAVATDVDESGGEETSEEEQEEQEEQEEHGSSSADSASDSGSGDDSQDENEDEKAAADNAGRGQQQEAWTHPLESLRCYCDLQPDSQLYGEGQRHFERGPTAKYPNRGRKFFCCGQGMRARGSRCSYFAWAEPPVDLSSKQQQQAPQSDPDATLSEKLLQATQRKAHREAQSATVAATSMEDLRDLTPAAALRKLKKLDRQIAELAQGAASGLALTVQQKAKLGRAAAVKQMLVDAEKAVVQAAFAAPQLVIRQAPQAAEVAAAGGLTDAGKDAPDEGGATAAAARTASVSASLAAAPAPATREGGFLAASASLSVQLSLTL